MIISALSSSKGPRERMVDYFLTSFTIGLTFPRQKEIVEYVFSGLNPDLTNKIMVQYGPTYYYLEKLYNDCRNAGLIREEISIETFYKLCNMFTRITPDFYQTKDEMDLIIESIIRSFK